MYLGRFHKIVCSYKINRDRSAKWCSIDTDTAIIAAPRLIECYIHHNGCKMQRSNFRFPYRHTVIDVSLGKQAEIRISVIVKCLKDIIEIRSFHLIICNNAELSGFFVFRQDELVVLAEIIKQEHPEINIVNFMEVQQNAIVGILPVRGLCIHFRHPNYTQQQDEQDR